MNSYSVSSGIWINLMYIYRSREDKLVSLNICTDINKQIVVHFGKNCCWEVRFEQISFHVAGYCFMHTWPLKSDVKILDVQGVAEISTVLWLYYCIFWILFYSADMYLFFDFNMWKLSQNTWFSYITKHMYM